MVSEPIKPDPDPTVLTTQNLQREIHAVLDLLDARRDGVEKALDVRLDGMDKALVLLQHAVDKSPSIGEVYAQFNEKFNGIANQFRERDVRTEQTAKEGKVSIDAALQAAKEAVGEQNKSNTAAIDKSEKATTKQLELIVQNMGTLEKGLVQQINDLKERQATADSNNRSVEGNKHGVTQVWGVVLAIGGVITGLIIASAAVITLVIKFTAK